MLRDCGKIYAKRKKTLNGKTREKSCGLTTPKKQLQKQMETPNCDALVTITVQLFIVVMP